MVGLPQVQRRAGEDGQSLAPWWLGIKIAPDARHLRLERGAALGVELLLQALHKIIEGRAVAPA